MPWIGCCPRLHAAICHTIGEVIKCLPTGMTKPVLRVCFQQFTCRREGLKIIEAIAFVGDDKNGGPVWAEQRHGRIKKGYQVRSMLDDMTGKGDQTYRAAVPARRRSMRHRSRRNPPAQSC